MSAFRAAGAAAEVAAAFRGTGQDAFIGVVGGFLGMPTGSPSITGGIGETIGMAARMKVDMISQGAHYATNRQVAQVSHFRSTGRGSAASRAAAAAALAAGSSRGATGSVAAAAARS
jgi:hypothetical protein